LDKNNFASVLANALEGDAKIAPIAGRAISELFNSQNPSITSLVRENLEKVIGLLERNLPVLCGWVLSALRGAFKLGFGDDILRISAKIISKVSVQPNHSLTKFYGTLPVAVDVGRDQRLNALELLGSLVQYSADRIDGTTFLNIALNVISDVEQRSDCRIAGLKILEQLAESKFTSALVLDSLSNIAVALEKLRKDSRSKENGMETVIDPLMHTIAMLHLKSQKGKSAEIERLFSCYEKEAKMEEILDDLGMALKIQNASAASTQNEALSLIHQYNPDAALIFA
jgi:hypothetical protein